MGFSPAARRRCGNGMLYIAMAVVTAVFVFPVLWAFSTSLKDAPQLFAAHPVYLPAHPQWGNYKTVIDEVPILRYLLNSVLIVALTVIVTLAVAVPAGYALSRFAFRGRGAYLMATLGAQLVSPIVLVIPLYRLFAELSLLNSYASLVVVYVAIQLPFTTWLMKGYLDTIPRALDEAALIDGCGRLRAMARAVLPSGAPGIASAAIIIAAQSWSQFVIPFILLDTSDRYPISVGVVNLKATTGQITTQYLAAGSIIAIVPVLVLFIALQRYIVNALTQGALK